MLRRRFLFCSLLTPALSFAQVEDGLVARYYFNKGAAVSDAGPYVPKAVGVSFGEDRFGNPNAALRLYGNSKSYLNLGTSPGLKPPEGSISVWVNIFQETYTGNGYPVNPIIMTKNHPGDDFFESYAIIYSLQNKRFGASATLSPLNQLSVNSAKPAELERWYHVVLTYSDRSLCMYVDGKLEACLEKDFRTPFLETDSVMIGNSANVKNNRFFSGWIDDLSIYNRPLTQAEVLKLYREGDPNFSRPIAKGIFFVLLALSGAFGVFVLLRWKLRGKPVDEQEKNRLQRQMHEMEMKVIKAQMNPHFIFNSMNSIQQFILADDTGNANTYLVKFSKLLRKILESSTDEYISVANEIDILDHYVEIESLRFGHALNCEIVADSKITGSNIRIPQMLIQPFVENAIWHGLLPKQGDKNLRITFEWVSPSLLRCTVDDNGVGRKAAQPQRINGEKNSLGIRFIHQRLELMRKEWGGEYQMEIIDKSDANGNSAGTQVRITLPIIKD